MQRISIDDIASSLIKLIGSEKMITFQCRTGKKYEHHPHCCIIFESNNINYLSKLFGNQFVNQSSKMTASMMTIKHGKHECNHSSYNDKSCFGIQCGIIAIPKDVYTSKSKTFSARGTMWDPWRSGWKHENPCSISDINENFNNLAINNSKNINSKNENYYYKQKEDATLNDGELMSRAYYLDIQKYRTVDKREVMHIMCYGSKGNKIVQYESKNLKIIKGNVKNINEFITVDDEIHVCVNNKNKTLSFYKNNNVEAKIGNIEQELDFDNFVHFYAFSSVSCNCVLKNGFQFNVAITIG